jgi:hypothetical protein
MSQTRPVELSALILPLRNAKVTRVPMTFLRGSSRPFDFATALA